MTLLFSQRLELRDRFEILGRPAARFRRMSWASVTTWTSRPNTGASARRPPVRLPTFRGEGLQEGLSLDAMGAIYDRMDDLR